VSTNYCYYKRNSAGQPVRIQNLTDLQSTLA